MDLVVTPIVLSLPFTGRWVVQNSPARRVPSHGTDLLGGRYAIDFVGVDDRFGRLGGGGGPARRFRTAPSRDWRTVFATEPPERFFAFGRPILAPVDGVVVAAHNREIDHEARRSQLALVPYALGQAARLRRGIGAIAGNYLTIELRGGGAFVGLAHLRAGSMLVSVGDEVTAGQPIAECGNSGNSTQPHVHIQVMDRADLVLAQGLPIAFRHFREWPRRPGSPQLREHGIPAEGAVVEPLPSL